MELIEHLIVVVFLSILFYLFFVLQEWQML